MVDGRKKGKRVEYLIRDKFREHGFDCERVPVSGAARGFKGDLNVEGYRVEVKARKSMKNLYNWFKQAVDGILVVKADFKKPLVVLDFSLFCEMLKMYLKNKKSTILK